MAIFKGCFGAQASPKASRRDGPPRSAKKAKKKERKATKAAIRAAANAAAQAAHADVVAAAAARFPPLVKRTSPPPPKHSPFNPNPYYVSPPQHSQYRDPPNAYAEIWAAQQRISTPRKGPLAFSTRCPVPLPPTRPPPTLNPVSLFDLDPKLVCLNDCVPQPAFKNTARRAATSLAAVPATPPSGVAHCPADEQTPGRYAQRSPRSRPNHRAASPTKSCLRRASSPTPIKRLRFHRDITAGDSPPPACRQAGKPQWTPYVSMKGLSLMRTPPGPLETDSPPSSPLVTARTALTLRTPPLPATAATAPVAGALAALLAQGTFVPDNFAVYSASPPAGGQRGRFILASGSAAVTAAMRQGADTVRHCLGPFSPLASRVAHSIRPPVRRMIDLSLFVDNAFSTTSAPGASDAAAKLAAAPALRVTPALQLPAAKGKGNSSPLKATPAGTNNKSTTSPAAVAGDAVVMGRPRAAARTRSGFFNSNNNNNKQSTARVIELTATSLGVFMPFSPCPPRRVAAQAATWASPAKSEVPASPVMRGGRLVFPMTPSPANATTASERQAAAEVGVSEAELERRLAAMPAAAHVLNDEHRLKFLLAMPAPDPLEEWEAKRVPQAATGQKGVWEALCCRLRQAPRRALQRTEQRLKRVLGLGRCC